jgi:hypothetical protein
MVKIMTAARIQTQGIRANRGFFPKFSLENYRSQLQKQQRKKAKQQGRTDFCLTFTYDQTIIFNFQFSIVHSSFSPLRMKIGSAATKI